MKSKYLQTHPWLTFSVDLRNAPASLWILAGEARSKLDHIAGVPLKPAVARELHQMYLAKGVQATTAIEGNTLTVDEVRQHLEGQLKLPQSKEYLAKEIDNILAGCNQIGDALISGRAARITPELLKEFNKLILRDLELEEGVIPGQVRNYRVRVGTYLAPDGDECDFLLEKLCNWIESDFTDESETKLITSVIKAIVFHIYLAWIHPFGDGNGRTARLIEFQILLAAGVTTPAAHLLSNHYNQTRKRYYAELDQASKSGGNILPFIQYALQGMVEGLREQLDLIQQQQWDVSWTDFVHEQFREEKNISALRQRTLVIDLSGVGVPVPMDKIPELSTTLAKAYAKKTLRTVQRDVSALEKKNLVERTPDGVRAKTEIILAFLPKPSPSAPSINTSNGSDSSQPDLPFGS